MWVRHYLMEIKRRMHSPRLTLIASLGYHLKRGLSATDAAEQAGCSRAYAYRVAASHNWPTNPSVAIESPREAQIVAAARVLTPSELSDAFSMARPLISQVLKRVDTRTKLEFA